MRRTWICVAATLIMAAVVDWRFGRGTTDRALPEIGLLAVGEQTYQAAFWRGLERNGLIDGRNIVVKRSIGSGDPADLAELSDQLVARPVAVIVATSSAAVEAALKRTSQVPIVSVTSADPLGSGFIKSFARPGGNVTGLAGVEPAVAAKSLQLLRLAVPNSHRIAVFWNPTHPIHPTFLKGVREYATRAGVSIDEVEVKANADVSAAFDAVDDLNADALLVLVDPAINRSRDEIVRQANLRRLPTMYPLGEFTAAGGLMSYGVDYADLHDRAADYVSRLLAGAQAAELPVERPLNFELVINMTTAAELKLSLPSELLLRAKTIRQEAQ